MTISQIWYILNQAVMGKVPVYELACRMHGLPEDVIYDMADKIHDDMHMTKAELDKEIHRQKMDNITRGLKI